MEVFANARAAQNLARTLVERTRRPSDLIDLYLVLGQANALMASIAFDLGNWQAAATLARSSTTYAELSGHGSLQAWTLGLQGTLAFWQNEPERSLGFVFRGLAVAPQGASRYRLRYIASRAHAVAGNAEAARAVLVEARHDKEVSVNFPDELHDEVRGEFTFDGARAAACAAAAWLYLKDGEQAAHHAREALDAYGQIPEVRRPFSPVTGARIDLASAYLLTGNREAAEAELGPVFALPADLRNVSLSGRLARTRFILGSPAWQGKPAAIELSDRMNDWLQETAANPGVVEDVM
ncbi:hypothetical protein E1294_26550 [Nonomuraea diastatica]|uniref:XRE family transcriptional regulator n=2 Tax=Nonomuraea diastatica TaxID=1848329 RepID=A0A4R4WG21_9ACTN|nr:hypothetical protein E1294_26550 [Nonomuraea diastatica]